MFNLAARKTPNVPPVVGLEALLSELERFGKPWLFKHDRGWRCKIDMHVTAAGAAFEISSEIGKESPISAAKECLERVQAALRTLGGGG